MRNQSVFNFVSQNVYPVNMKPTAFCCADNKLMVAFESPQRCIEVYDLHDDAKLVVTLKPFSHSIQQMLFCKAGNYIASFGRSNESPNVSVIFNWWLQEQPFVHRSAGSDLPFTEFSCLVTSPEVVSIPLDEINMLNLRYISCCDSSGNLVVCYGLLISVFKFQKTFFENLRPKPDFFHILNIRLSFIAYKVKICEDFMAFTSLNHVQVIRLLIENEDSNNSDKKDEIYFDECIEWNVNDETSMVSIPSLSCESADENMGLLSHYPEMTGPLSDELCCRIKTIVIAGNCKIKVRHEILLCRYMYENDYMETESDIIDVCLVPIYKATSNICKDPLKDLSNDDFCSSNPFNSTFYAQLLSCGCFVSTKNFGYLYSLKNEVKKVNRFCYEENAKAVAIEDTVVHVLTDASLKTYSLSLLNSIFHLTSNTVPLLLNSRLFLGTEQLLNSSAHVLLISKNISENNSYTIYSLEKPSFEDLYKDVKEFCDQEISNQTEISDQIDLLQFITVNIRLLDITSVYSCNERQKRHLSICLSLATRLMEHFEGVTFKSIVEYVYKDVDVDLKCLLQPIIVEKAETIVVEVIRLKLQKIFKSHCFDRETLFKLLKLVKSEDIDIIKAAVFNYSFEKDDKQQVMRCIEGIHHREQELLHAKICFDCSEIEEVKTWLLNEDNDLLYILLSNYKLLLPLNPFSTFIAKEKSDLFINFCLSCLDNEYFSTQQMANSVVESQEILYLFLDAVFCSRNTFLEPCLLTVITNGYIDAIRAEFNVCSKKNRSKKKVKQKPEFLQLLLPIHKNCENCVCSVCSPEYEKLNYLLHVTRSKEAINIVTELLKQPNTDHLKLLNIFVLEYEEVLQIMYEMNSDAIIPFTLDPRNTFKEKWKFLFQNIVEKKFTSEDYENTMIQVIFLNLSESLTPWEFIDLIPEKWSSIANIYFKKCLERHESQALKDKIVNLGNELKSMITLT